MTQQKLYYLFRIATLGQPEQLGCSVYSSIHDSIMPSKLKFTSRIAPDVNQVNTLKMACLNSTSQKLSDKIDKNAIISEYNVSCQKCGIKEKVATITKGEPTTIPTTIPTSYPTISQLVRGCSMKPSMNHQYRVKDLKLDHVIIKLIKSSKSFLTDEDITNLSEVDSLYREMISDVAELKNLDFCTLREPRLGYAEQTEIQSSRVDMATACAVHYSLHPGMVIRYIKGEYVGENRNVLKILNDISSHVDETDTAHIKRILTQGCPSRLNFEETSDMKASIIKKGNQVTFRMHPEIVTKTMNKEDRHSHVLPVKLWVLHFSPWCRHTAQGMLIKPGKNPRVIFDASTKSHPHEVVLNDMTSTEFEANITFGRAKLKLLQRIYNLRVSHPKRKIYLALADICACFRFPRVHADLTGAFGFMAERLYFLATSMVFGSTASASSWEPFRRAIEGLIIEYSTRPDLISKHKHLLDMLKWEDEDTMAIDDFVKAVACPLNPGLPDLDEFLEAYIYVDDILGSAVGKFNILRLLAATIEAIFVVCGRANIEVRQCSLSLEKWLELVVGSIQTVLGLTVDTNRLTVAITKEYRDQVSELITLHWPISRRIFKVTDIQKLVGKLARLGEGAPWIYKIMSHIYTSLAFALRQNKELLLVCSSKFREIVGNIQRGNFFGSHSEIARELNFALKTAARMVNHHKQFYFINETMRAEIEFICQALREDYWLNFEVPIAFIIPRTPSASLFGDSSLRACGGYSTTLRTWWYLSFPDFIIERTLLHLKNNNDETFISINCLEYVTIIINYCAAITAISEGNIINDPHPVVLCVTDNISAKNWTTHTCKKSIIGRALARFFCGLLIGSDVGINATWISTVENKIADEISRIKKSTHDSFSFQYDFAKLQQDHAELRHCCFFQPSQELLSMIWDILLTRNSPDLNKVRLLKQSGLGKLNI